MRGLFFLSSIFIVLTAPRCHRLKAKGMSKASKAEDWGYRDHNGPHNWPNLCQTGLSQSPVDFRMRDVDYAALNRFHFVNYDHPGRVEVVNNGHTLSVSGYDKWGQKQPYIQGGGLKHKYSLIQFHLHWGSHDHEGSEHKVGGLHYPAELHLVHQRSDLSLQQALTKPDGLAVIGVFMVVDEDGSAMSALDKVMEAIAVPNNRTSLTGFRTRPMLPQSTESFYRYDGSLTTPPSCAETVIWTLLAEPISMTRSQVTLLRQLQAPDLQLMDHNYRPAQPLNGRRVLFRPSQFERNILCPSSASSFFVSVSLVLTILIID